MDIILGYKTVRIKEQIKATEEQLYRISEYYHKSAKNKKDIKNSYASKLNKERLERIALTVEMLAKKRTREDISKKLKVKGSTIDSYISTIISEK